MNAGHAYVESARAGGGNDRVCCSQYLVLAVDNWREFSRAHHFHCQWTWKAGMFYHCQCGRNAALAATSRVRPHATRWRNRIIRFFHRLNFVSVLSNCRWQANTHWMLMDMFDHAICKDFLYNLLLFLLFIDILAYNWSTCNTNLLK